MASYNGERFIRKQIDSIMIQLGEDDELVIVDDQSNDNTVSIIQSYSDRRVRLFTNPRNLGVVKSFERTIMLSKNNYIFLSDQDDIWKIDKVQVIMQKFLLDDDISMILSNAEFIDETGKLSGELFYPKGFSGSFFGNLKRNNFLGCCIAFKKKGFNTIFPFPENLPMHDVWLGLNHILYGKIHFVNRPLISYRRHGGNVTTGKSAPFATMIKWRWVLINSLFKRFLNRKK